MCVSKSLPVTKLVLPVVASCTDATQNGNEQGIDCGGSCAPCAECASDSDCSQDQVCAQGK